MKTWQIALVLAIVAGFSGVLIALVNYATEDIIAKNELNEKNELVTEFFEDVNTDKLEWLEIEGYDKVEEKTYVFDNENNPLGIVYVASGTNAYGDISVVIAVDSEDKIIEIKYLELKQTPGFGDKVDTDEYKSQYIGMQLNDVNVDAVSGATYSSNLVSSLVLEVGYAHYDQEVSKAEETKVPLYWFGIFGVLLIGGPILVWRVGVKREQN